MQNLELQDLLNIFNSAKIEFEENFIVLQGSTTRKLEYKISEDLKEITIQGKHFNIPDFFNREMIKIRDLKTMQMVFYSILDDMIRLKNKEKTNAKK